MDAITLSNTNDYEIVEVYSTLTGELHSDTDLPYTMQGAGNESLIITVKFDPTLSQPYGETITISSSDPNEPLITIELLGEGIPVPHLNILEPVGNFVNYGQLLNDGAGNESLSKTIVIENNGSGSLIINQNGIELLKGDHFGIVQVMSDVDGLVDLSGGPAQIESDSTEKWEITVRYDPSDYGPLDDNLVIKSDDLAGYAYVGLKGVGLKDMDIDISDNEGNPDDLNMEFDDTHADGPGSQNYTNSIVIRNTGEAHLEIADFRINSDDYYVGNITSDLQGAITEFPNTIQGFSNETWFVDIVFDPDYGTSNAVATLTVNNDDPDESQVVVHLNGTGLSKPAIRVLDSDGVGDDHAVDFGFCLNDGAGERNKQHTLLIENIGVEPLIIAQNSISCLVGEGYSVLDIESSTEGPVDITSPSDADRAISPAFAQPLYISAVSQGQHGQVIITNDGKRVAYRPDPEYIGEDRFTYTVENGLGHSDVGTVQVTVKEAPDRTPLFEYGMATNVSDQWQTITLDYYYNSMVVVCTPIYSENEPPAIVRTRNAQGNSFEMRIDCPASGDTEVPLTVNYFVVEEGVYNVAEHGVKMEAGKVLSQATMYNSVLLPIPIWYGEDVSYSNEYSTPIVMSQVMTYNDPQWSVAFCQGSLASLPPSSSSLQIGKHCGHVLMFGSREDEEIGYIVMESGNGSLDGVPYWTAFGPYTTNGMDHTPPFTLYDTGASSNAQFAVAFQNARNLIFGGGWGILYDYDPSCVMSNELYVATDDDLANRTRTVDCMVYLVLGKEPMQDVLQGNTDEYAVKQADRSMSMDVTSNDKTASADPDSTTITSVKKISGDGEMVNAGGQKLTYIPEEGATEEASFEYTVKNDKGYIETAEITVRSTAESDNIVASNDTLTVRQNSQAVVLNVLANDVNVTPDDEFWTVTLQFDPTENSAYPDTLSILSNDPEAPQSDVSLMGVGEQPVITLTRPDRLLHTPAEQVFDIMWDDAYNAGNAEINLYLDADTDPASGLIPLISNWSEDETVNTFEWRPDASMIGQEYFFYATIEDGSVTQDSYSAFPVHIDEEDSFHVASPVKVTSGHYAYQYVYNGQFYEGVTTLSNGVNTVSVVTALPGGETVNHQFFVEVTDSLIHTENYTYDEMHRIKTYRNGNGIVTTFTYDKLGRLVKTEADNGNTVEYDYDVVGRRTHMRDSTGWTFYRYDDLDRLTNLVTSANSEFGDADDLKIEYEYDLANSMTAMVYPGGERIEYAYDNANRMTEVYNVTHDQRTTYHYDYTKGVLQSVDLPNGITTIYTSDHMGRVEKIRHERTATHALVAEFEYQINSLGFADYMITRLEDGTEKKETYVYDEFDRIHIVTYSDDLTIGPEDEKVTFTYDNNGNRLSKVTEQNGAIQEALTYHYGNENRLLKVTDQTDAVVAEYKYDAAGNRIQKITPDDTVYYSYDERNYLIKLKSNNSYIEMNYNGNGILNEIIDKGVKTLCIYDQSKIIPQIIQKRDSENIVISSYTLGYNAIFKYMPNEIELYLRDRVNSVRVTTGIDGHIIDMTSFYVHGCKIQIQ